MFDYLKTLIENSDKTTVALVAIAGAIVISAAWATFSQKFMD